MVASLVLDLVQFTYHATVVDDDGMPEGNITVTPAGFECSLDGSVFEDCDPMNPQNQTKIYSDLDPGSHHFEVRAYVLNSTMRSNRSNSS